MDYVLPILSGFAAGILVRLPRLLFEGARDGLHEGNTWDHEGT